MNSTYPIDRNHAIYCPTVNGERFLIDEADFHKVYGKRWYRNKTTGYIQDNWGRYLHREILDPPDHLETDHKNGNKNDNRLCNLRAVTHSQNCMNRGPCRNSSSRYKGVSWYSQRSKWQSKLGEYWLGYFDDELEAAQRFDEEARKRHGPFAWLNCQHFPELNHAP